MAFCCGNNSSVLNEETEAVNDAIEAELTEAARKEAPIKLLLLGCELVAIYYL
jgi:hypothetical protein